MHNLLQCSLFLFLICFRQEGLGSEIINGHKVKNNLMPYMASVQNDQGHVCGGFLISEDFVMTAAHCGDSKTLTVVLGTHNLKKVTKTMKYSTKKCKHQQYKNVSLGNDIMLLKLSKKAYLGKHQIKPVPIPSKPRNLKDHTKCKVAGWGSIKTGGGSVNELYATDVSIINQKTCRTSWENRLPANIICAGGYDSDKGFCQVFPLYGALSQKTKYNPISSQSDCDVFLQQGDSGGPLVCDKMAVGIVSFNNGRNCNYPEKPNIYTDLSKHLPWVRAILKKKTC
uniref:trypsin n=1 Tax=Gouania willdenowi TaxID=441366 RepID=A0A8C5D6J1_GOUWI